MSVIRFGKTVPPPAALVSSSLLDDTLSVHALGVVTGPLGPCKAVGSFSRVQVEKDAQEPKPARRTQMTTRLKIKPTCLFTRSR